MELKDYEPQSLPEVELAVDGWRMGEWPSRILKDNLDTMTEFSIGVDPEQADEFRILFDKYGFDVLTLLELWIGYVQASEDEGTEATVSDFILATYEALRHQ